MTDNTIERMLEQMGKSYRSWKPRQERVEATWNFLVQELNVADPVAVREPVFALPSFRSLFSISVLRPVLAILFVAVVGLGALLKVASASLPGDALYTVKLVRERAQVRLTVDDTARAQLQTQLAKKRTDEVQQVVAREESQEVKKERLAVAVAGLHQNVQDVSAALTKLAEKKVLAEEVERETAAMVEILSEVKESADASNGEVAKTVQSVLAFVTETNALVKIAAHPPETLAQSVMAPGSVPPFEPVEQEKAERRVKEQITAALNPAQSVFSLPFATSINSPENALPYVMSVQSPENLPFVESIQSQ